MHADFHFRFQREREGQGDGDEGMEGKRRGVNYNHGKTRRFLDMRCELRGDSGILG